MGIRGMDPGQHGLESEAALQSLPTGIADYRPRFQIQFPVEKTPLRLPAKACERRITDHFGTYPPNSLGNV